jgi:hypothetical protein
MASARVLSACFAAIFASGCGIGGPAEHLDVTVSPDSAIISTYDTITFSATVSPDNGPAGVQWYVVEGDSAGTISSNGLFKATGSASTYHVVARARSNADTARIVVVPRPFILQFRLHPNQIAPGDSAFFAAWFTGDGILQPGGIVMSPNGTEISRGRLYQTTTFMLLVTNAAKDTVRSSLTVEVGASGGQSP